MKKSTNVTLTILGLIALAGIYFVLIPYVDRREASRIVDRVLNLWSTQNLTTTYEYWLDPQKSPPVFGLNTYQVKSQKFDTQDGAAHALFTVYLEFSLDNFMPSKRNWILELKKTKYGWKIIDFYMANSKP